MSPLFNDLSIDIMTIYSHNMDISSLIREYNMKSAKIAQFKAELSKYLKYVRKGEEVIILDRTTPLARVLPFKQEDDFVLEEAVESAHKLFSIKVEPIPGLKSSLEFLREERGDR